MPAVAFNMDKFTAALVAASAPRPRRRVLDHAVLAAALRRRVVGQAEVVAGIADALAAGFADGGRVGPALAATFVGPDRGKFEVAKGVAEAVYGSESHLVHVPADAPDLLVALSRALLMRPETVVLITDAERLSPADRAALEAAVTAGHLSISGDRPADFRDAVVLLTSESPGFAFAGATAIAFRAPTYVEAAPVVLVLVARGTPVDRIANGLGHLLGRPVDDVLATAVVQAAASRPNPEALAILLALAVGDRIALRAYLADPAHDFAPVWHAMASHQPLIAAFDAFLAADLAAHPDGEPLPAWYSMLAAAAPTAPWAMRIFARCGASA